MKKTIGDIEVFYTIEGEGPWLTMSHSLACNTTAWDAQAALLSKNFKVLRYDTRGHGKTSATPGPYSLEQLADDAYGHLHGWHDWANHGTKVPKAFYQPNAHRHDEPPPG
jgi:3-oxoadipate enol-lactonase